MLAVIRKVNAMGRIRLLTSSTNTIKLISSKGVPEGIKCDKKWKKKFDQKKIITINHIEKLKGKVILRWEVREKMKGNKEEKFIKNKKTKTEIIIFANPFFKEPKEYSISLKRNENMVIIRLYIKELHQSNKGRVSIR